MNIFGNKNKKEIENIQENVSTILTTINELKKENEEIKNENKKIKEQSKQMESNFAKNEEKIDKVDGIFQSMFDQHEAKILKMDKKIDKIKEILDIIIDTNKKEQKETKTTSKKHLYEYENEVKLYTGLKLDGNKIVAMRGKPIPFTIEDIIKIKGNLETYHSKGYSTGKIGKLHGIGKGTIKKVIYNIEEGTFDDLIEEWGKTKQKQTNTKKGQKQHYRYVSDSLQIPMAKNLTVMDGGELKANGRTLKYTIQEVLMLQERIIDFNNYPTMDSLGEGINLNTATLKTLVWRIEEGYFDDVIQEFLSRKYTYENNFNRLFIDGKNTGLSIDKCIAIIECIVNSGNKADTVNNLIKMYPTIESKYIRIISDEYNNPNLGKVLKKEVKKVEAIDNPQKRREAGVFL